MKKLVYNEGVFKSKWLSKFISCFMSQGKNYQVEKFLYFSFFLLKKKFNVNSLFFFFEVLEQLKPWVGLYLRKISKSTKKKLYGCPKLLNTNNQYKKAIYWFITSIKIRKELCVINSIYYEIESIIFKELSTGIKKKKNYYNYTLMFQSVTKFKW